MAHGIKFAHDNGRHQADPFCKLTTIGDDKHFQIAEDEQEEEEEAEELTDDNDDSESEDEVDESVMEDMQKLEENFRGISRKYRLINRIGEGDLELYHFVERPSDRSDHLRDLLHRI